jgi:hypothetical protein
MLKSRIHRTLQLQERHTVDNLYQWILTMMNKFAIDLLKIVAVVHDNATNVVSAMRMQNQLPVWEIFAVLRILCSSSFIQRFTQMMTSKLRLVSKAR